MGKVTDLSGELIGGLAVLSLIGTNGRRKAVWECYCTCGNVIALDSQALIRRSHRSRRNYGCGCTRRFTLSDVEQRLMENRTVDPVTECWNWNGTKTPEGYGRIGFTASGRQQRDVHRIAAHLWCGIDMDADVFVLHSCDNPPCFNPEHLFEGDNGANMLDCHSKGRHPRVGQQLAKTECPHGHSYSGENLIVMASGSRACRTCMTARSRAYKKRQRLESL